MTQPTGTAPEHSTHPEAADAPPGGPPTPAPASTAPASSVGPWITTHTVDRVVVAALLIAVGLAWWLDELGVSVPWALAPAVGAIVVGIALVVTAHRPGRRSGLVALGAVLVALAVTLAVAPPTSGPSGDRTVAPTAEQWPVTTSLSAGTLTVDLTRNRLPVAGTLTARVGVGRVLLLLPNAVGARPVHVTAHVGMGEVLVDGRHVQGGIGVDWSSPDVSAVVVDVRLSAGQVEVRHG